MLQAQEPKEAGQSCGLCYCPETMQDLTSCECPPSLNAGDCATGLVCSRSKEQKQQIAQQRGITADFIFDQIKLANASSHHAPGTSLTEEENDAIRTLEKYPQPPGVCTPKGNFCALTFQDDQVLSFRILK